MVIKHNIKIKNFGPIHEANIDISPLTIFIGPNNSGKSYTSLLIHCLLNPANENKLENFQDLSYEQMITNTPELFLEFCREFEKYLDSNPTFNTDTFKFPLEKFNKLINNGIGIQYQSLIEEKLRINFNIPKLNNVTNDNAFEFTFDNISFLNEENKIIMKNFNMNSIFNSETISESQKLLKINHDHESVLITLNHTLISKMINNEELLPSLIYDLLAKIFIIYKTNNSYYIPASGYEISANLSYVISNELNGLIEPPNIEKELITNLLKPRKDDKNNIFYDIANRMEKDILGGEIIFKNNGITDEIILIDAKNNVEFEFSSLSSSIKEIAPLVIYLKYELRKGDTLIIEEIEKHLHPKNQRKLVKYLVEAINNGLNIILTTHSDYILEQFNNFIRLDNSNDELLKELNYNEKNILNHENVKIYNFVKESDYKYHVKSVLVNQTGFVDENFTEITDELHDETVTIIKSKSLSKISMKTT